MGFPSLYSVKGRPPRSLEHGEAVDKQVFLLMGPGVPICSQAQGRLFLGLDVSKAGRGCRLEDLGRCSGPTAHLFPPLAWRHTVAESPAIGATYDNIAQGIAPRLGLVGMDWH